MPNGGTLMSLLLLGVRPAHFIAFSLHAVLTCGVKRDLSCAVVPDWTVTGSGSAQARTLTYSHCVCSCSYAFLVPCHTPLWPSNGSERVFFETGLDEWSLLLFGTYVRPSVSLSLSLFLLLDAGCCKPAMTYSAYLCMWGVANHLTGGSSSWCCR